MDVHVCSCGADGGELEPRCVLSVPPISLAWIEERRLPTPEESEIQKQGVTLPGGEVVDIAVVYQAGFPGLTLHLFQKGTQFLLMSGDRLHVMVRTPMGSTLSLDVYPEQPSTAVGR